MQKSFIPLAIAAALTLSAPARAANENVTVYGQANVSYDMISTGTANGVGALPGISSSRVSSNSSRLGLKGSNDLGSGWSALWQVEGTVGADTGASGGAGTIAGASARSTRLFDRDTYLGLSHADLGTLLLGRHDTPYKMSTRRLDVFPDGIGDNRSLLGTTIIGGAGPAGVVTDTFDARQSNQIIYISPALGSYSGALGYSNLAEGNTYSSQNSVSALSLAGMYEQDPVYATFAYEVHTITPPAITQSPSTAVKAVKLGLGYRMDILNLGFALEKSSDDFGNADVVVANNPCGNLTSGANCSGHSTLYLSAKLNITPADALKVAYSKAGQVGAASIASGAIQFSMGIDHDINQRTTVYILYTSLKNDRLVHYGLSSAASSGANSVNPTGEGGASPSAFSFGIRHSF